jgi:hypothetical protein
MSSFSTWGCPTETDWIYPRFAHLVGDSAIVLGTGPNDKIEALDAGADDHQPPFGVGGCAAPARGAAPKWWRVQTSCRSSVSAMSRST